MAEKGLVGARIDAEWAAGVSFIDLWEFNDEKYEVFNREFPIRSLGGLVVLFTEEIYPRSETRQIGHRRSLINLARDNPARLTLTSSLIEAAAEQRGEGHEVTDALRARNVQTREHGPDEAWAIPDLALELVEHVAATRTD